MPAWLLSLLSWFAPKVIEWALNFLEQKYPGLKDIIDQIIKFIQGHPSGPAMGARVMKAHIDGLCSGEICPPNLKNES